MKITMRIPTVQFGYIEIESGEESTVNDVIRKYNEIIGLYETTKADIQKLKDDNF